MTILYTTSFAGGNEDPLSETGKWSGDGVNGAIRLITNAIATHSADTDSSSRVTGITTPNAEHYAKVRYSTLGPTNSDGGPAVSCDSLGNHYFLTHFSGAMHLFRLRGNGTTFEERSGGGAPFTTTMTANDVWQIERRGSGLTTNLIATQNGVQRINFTDNGDANALAAGGTFGIHMFDGTLRFNLFEGGDFLSGATPVPMMGGMCL